MLIRAKKTLQREGGFSLPEVSVATLVVGIVFVALYSAIGSGFRVMQSTREHIRATQILQDKVETFRLYNWDQIISDIYIPKTFTAPFYPLGQGGEAQMLSYEGRIKIEPVTLNASYSNDMRRVTITVSWNSQGREVSKEMTTYTSRYGLQNYIY